MKENNVPWESIWDAINLGLILIDEKGQVLEWNKWVARYSGIPAEFAVGHSLDSLFPDGLSNPFKTAIKNALSHKLPIVLSNALHRSPLPLYPEPLSEREQSRIQQSITLTPIITPDGLHRCLLQITDSSLSIKRERVLKLQSDMYSTEAMTDSLTGAYNRRFFDQRLSAEFSRAQRQDSPLSLLMLDIDFFKDYNDNYGHPAGDKILRSVVGIMKSHMFRGTDLVTRYGGEEFAIILPDCGTTGALSVAEKLRASVSSLHLPHCKSKIADHITLSIGSSTLEAGSKHTAAYLLETADSALYNAKKAGRNCVTHFVTPE